MIRLWAALALLAGCVQGDRLCPNGLPCYAQVRTNAALIRPRGTVVDPAIPPGPQRGAALSRGNFSSSIRTVAVADFDAATLTVFLNDRRRSPEGRLEEWLPRLHAARPLTADEQARLIPLANDIWSLERFRAIPPPQLVMDDFASLQLFSGAEELSFHRVHGNGLMESLEEMASALVRSLREAAGRRG